MSDSVNAFQQPEDDPCATVSDEQLTGFLHDSFVLITAEDELLVRLASLVEQPFDAEAQRRAKEYLGSRTLSDATRAARKLGGRP